MRLEYAGDCIALRVTEEEPPGSPTAGDVRLEVEALINGFAGSGTCWVSGRDMQAFAVTLERLYSAFDVSVTLRSLSPGEFSLSLTPANARGYVLVEINISKHLPRGWKPWDGSSARCRAGLRPNLAP